MICPFSSECHPISLSCKLNVTLNTPYSVLKAVLWNRTRRANTNTKRKHIRWATQNLNHAPSSKKKKTCIRPDTQQWVKKRHTENIVAPLVVLKFITSPQKSCIFHRPWGGTLKLRHLGKLKLHLRPQGLQWCSHSGPEILIIQLAHKYGPLDKDVKTKDQKINLKH